MRLCRTSKDLKFSFLPSPLTQNLDKQVNSNINKESSQSIPPKKSFQKKSLKKNLPKKFLPKKSSQKISPQKILQKIPPKKSFGKIPWKFQKKSTESSKIKYKNSKNSPTTFKKIKKKIPNNFKSKFQIPKILKISNSLQRTWRPKTLLGLLWCKMSIFWRAGMREGGKPLPLACQYLIFMV